MKEMNDNIRSIKIKLGPSVDEWAVIIHMYVWLKTGKVLRAKRISHKKGLERMFVTEVNLMFDEVRRKYYGSEKFDPTSPVATGFKSLCKKGVTSDHDIWEGVLYNKMKNKRKHDGKKRR